MNEEEDDDEEEEDDDDEEEEKKLRYPQRLLVQTDLTVQPLFDSQHA